MWSLTSPRAKCISGPRKFRWSPQKDFCNTIGATADVICSQRVFRLLTHSGPSQSKTIQFAVRTFPSAYGDWAGWEDTHVAPGAQEFVTLVGGAIAWPLGVHAQQAHHTYRLGFLRVGQPPDAFIAGFRRGLHERGLIEGQNIFIEWGLAPSVTKLPIR